MKNIYGMIFCDITRNQSKAHDAARTEIIERYGIYVLRFSNKDIDENFDGVCRMIDRVILERIEKLP